MSNGTGEQREEGGLFMYGSGVRKQGGRASVLLVCDYYVGTLKATPGQRQRQPHE